MPYFKAPVLLQVKVGEVDIRVEPLAGDDMDVLTTVVVEVVLVDEVVAVAAL